jgi:hypothetical protein
VTALLREPRPSSRASRVPVSRAPGQRQAQQQRLPASAEEILRLQRIVGNRATDLAIQRARTPSSSNRNAQPSGNSQADERETAEQEKKGENYLTGRAGGHAERIGATPDTLWLPGAVSGELGKSNTATLLNGTAQGDAHGLDPNGVPGVLHGAMGLNDTANVTALGADALGLPSKIAALRKALKDQREAEGPGAGGATAPARRKAGMAKTKVAFGVAGTARSAIRTANNGVTLAHTAGQASGHAAAVGGLVAAPAGLAMAVANLTKNVVKLKKQATRMRQVAEELNNFDASPDVRNARTLMADRARQLLLTRDEASQYRAALAELDASMREHRNTVRGIYRDVVTGNAGQGAMDQWSDLAEQLEKLEETKRDCARRLRQVEADVRRVEAEKQRDDEAYGPMAEAGRAPAEEIRNLKEGDRPSLKTIAYYSRAKNLKGARRKTAQLISDSLGIAAYGMATAAVASGPAALAAAPASAAVVAAWSAVALGIAGEKGKSYLTKRSRRMNEGEAYRQTGVDKATPEPIYGKIEGFLGRTWANVSRAKLFNRPEEGSTPTEIKSRRTIMAEALWDSATNSKYDDSVRETAWSLITTLTGRTETDIVGHASPDDPKIRDRALTLLKDKLASG